MQDLSPNVLFFFLVSYPTQFCITSREGREKKPTLPIGQHRESPSSLLRANLRVFWLNIAKFKVNWCYRYWFKLFRKLRKEKELRQYHCRNSTKVGERKIKSRREKFFIFGNGIAAIPSAHSATGWEKKIWQLWQCHYRK